MRAVLLGAACNSTLRPHLVQHLAMLQHQGLEVGDTLAGLNHGRELPGSQRCLARLPSTAALDEDASVQIIATVHQHDPADGTP